MPMLVRMTILVIALASIQGCASFRGAPTWDPTKTLNASDAVYDEYVKKFFAATTPSARATIRNEYITVRIAQFNRIYDDYKQELYAQRVSSGVGFNVATLTLAGTAAAVADVGTKTGAAALATLLTGTQTSIDKNVYFDRTLPAMLSQMDGLRSVVRARLFAGILLPDDRYSLSEADNDLSDYRQAGTVYAAVSAITSQAGQAQAAAEKVMRDRLPTESEIRARLTSKGFMVEQAAITDTTEQLKKCVRSDGSFSPGVEAPLRAWFAKAQPEWIKTLKKDELPPASITPLSDFMSIKAYDSLRTQAFADSALGPILTACK